MNLPYPADMFAGRTAFIAGASSGINLAIATAFACHGARVGLISRHQERIDVAADGIRATGGQALGLAADVRDYDAVSQALAQTREAFGPIDIVISGAAGNFIAPAIGMSANAFKTVVDIDLIGTFNVFRAAFDHLSPSQASLIAITAPQAVVPRQFQAHACAAKAGVNMLVKCLAMEWGAAGIRVNGISPGRSKALKAWRACHPRLNMRRTPDKSWPCVPTGKPATSPPWRYSCAVMLPVTSRAAFWIAMAAASLAMPPPTH